MASPTKARGIIFRRIRRDHFSMKIALGIITLYVSGRGINRRE